MKECDEILSRKYRSCFYYLMLIYEKAINRIPKSADDRNIYIYEEMDIKLDKLINYRTPTKTIPRN